MGMTTTSNSDDIEEFLEDMQEAAAGSSYRRRFPTYVPMRTRVVFVPTPVYVVPSGPIRALHSARFNGGRPLESAPRSIVSSSYHEGDRDRSEAGGASVASSLRTHGSRSNTRGNQEATDRAASRSGNSRASRSDASTARPQASSRSNTGGSRTGSRATSRANVTPARTTPAPPVPSMVGGAARSLAGSVRPDDSVTYASSDRQHQSAAPSRTNSRVNDWASQVSASQAGGSRRSTAGYRAPGAASSVAASRVVTGRRRELDLVRGQRSSNLKPNVLLLNQPLSNIFLGNTIVPPSHSMNINNVSYTHLPYGNSENSSSSSSEAEEPHFSSLSYTSAITNIPRQIDILLARYGGRTHFPELRRNPHFRILAAPPGQLSLHHYINQGYLDRNSRNFDRGLDPSDGFFEPTNYRAIVSELEALPGFLRNSRRTRVD
ncbi:hypothetical protein BU16DRAFT_534010 [Lophium mytilinum]|uniref:Uncharacterized protein n=1 Tax=Lophium mytilinum TaxID=390894 RepID=A0A6A6R9J7_9PEZI|nr:hypothetical protein BU16DRAFT_534010 [Lophium mytilinum]